MQSSHTQGTWRGAGWYLTIWPALLLLLLFSSVSIHAQSAYLEEGQSGLGASMGYSRVSGTDGGYFALGLGIAGRLDIGFRTAGVDDRDSESSWRYGPSIAVYPIRQKAGVRLFSVAVTASADFYRKTLPNLADPPRVYYGGMLLFTDYRVKHGTYLQPRAGVSYRYVNQGEMDDAAIVQMGLSYYSRSGDEMCFAVTTGISTDFDDVQLDFGLEIVFPFRGWREL